MGAAWVLHPVVATTPSFAPLLLQADLVDEAIRSTNERYSNMSPAEFASLKQALQHAQSGLACFAAATATDNHPV